MLIVVILTVSVQENNKTDGSQRKQKKTAKINTWNEEKGQQNKIKNECIFMQERGTRGTLKKIKPRYYVIEASPITERDFQYSHVILLPIVAGKLTEKRFVFLFFD